ncbi:MAG: outer rane biosis protein BamB [Schlesneria sp.]|nr:outer rane biosis protein BamB [Schlesneria sp.]
MRGRQFIAALSWVSLLLFVQVVQSTEPDSHAGWPQWRGPTFDAISSETGLADTWPEAGPPVLWSRELGQGYSSFIAVGPHVYTLNQTLYEQAVVCLDAETGQTVWSSRYSWPYEGGGLYPIVFGTMSAIQIVRVISGAIAWSWSVFGRRRYDRVEY